MALFDIIDTSGKAYIKAWEERVYLLHLAVMPLVMKVLFFSIIMIMNAENNILRSTLIMLPAYFFEGWLVAHVVRLIVFGERWPASFRTETDFLPPASKKRSDMIFGAILIYVLIKMILSGLFASFAMDQEQLQSYADNNEPSFVILLLSCLFLTAFVWLFKFVFLHIPFAAGISIKVYREKLSGLMPSLYVLGIWLTCYVPFILGGLIIIDLFSSLLSSIPSLLLLIFYFVHFCVDLVALIVMSIAFSIVMRDIFFFKNNQSRLEP